MAAEGEAPEHEEPQQQEFAGTEAGWDDPGGEPGDLSSLSAQTEWLNQQVSPSTRGRPGRGSARETERHSALAPVLLGALRSRLAAVPEESGAGARRSPRAERSIPSLFVACPRGAYISGDPSVPTVTRRAALFAASTCI